MTAIVASLSTLLVKWFLDSFPQWQGTSPSPFFLWGAMQPLHSFNHFNCPRITVHRNYAPVILHCFLYIRKKMEQLVCGILVFLTLLKLCSPNLVFHHYWSFFAAFGPVLQRMCKFIFADIFLPRIILGIILSQWKFLECFSTFTVH